MQRFAPFFYSFFAAFFLFQSPLYSKENIELFVDYLWDAKGQDLFQFLDDDSVDSLSLFPRIRKELLQRNFDIKSWEVERYSPELLTIGQARSVTDLWVCLKKAFAPPQLIDQETKFWVFWSLGPKVRNLDFSVLPKDQMVLFMWEPCVVQPESHDPKVHKNFSKIFTWDDDLVDGIKYFKFYYPVLKSQIASIPKFSDKKFCTLINSRLISKHPDELYSEREKVIRFFEDKPLEFDLYGRGWEKRKFKNYKGPIADKIDVLKNYKFCICYENTKNVKGYITEKIFDCFSAGVVPVYLGACNVEEYVPSSTFIDRRRFKDEDALYEYLKSLDEDSYQRYLDSAASFLLSEDAQKFSEKYFVETFLQIVRP